MNWGRWRRTWWTGRTVFTGGIGENSAVIRARICRDAAWLGLDSDEAANKTGATRISQPDSRVTAWAIPTNEELMIAQHTRRVLAIFKIYEKPPILKEAEVLQEYKNGNGNQFIGKNRRRIRRR